MLFLKHPYLPSGMRTKTKHWQRATRWLATHHHSVESHYTHSKHVEQLRSSLTSLLNKESANDVSPVQAFQIIRKQILENEQLNKKIAHLKEIDLLKLAYLFKKDTEEALLSSRAPSNTAVGVLDSNHPHANLLEFAAGIFFFMFFFN